MTDWLAKGSGQAQGGAEEVKGPLVRRDGRWVRQSDGKPVCGAVSKTNPIGICCQFINLHPSTGRCRYHKGLSGTVGIAHPAYKHGRYSKHLPTRLVEQYQAALEDGDLLSQRDEIALLQSRLADLLPQVSTGESIRGWKLAGKLFADMKRANQRGDANGIAIAVQALERVLERGATEAASWKEVLELVEQRRKIVQTEHEHQDRQEQMITVEKALLLIGALHSAVMTHVRDNHARQAIAAEFLRISEGAAR